MLSCARCGAAVYEAWSHCPRCGAAQNAASADPDDRRRRSFPVAVAICLKRYARFCGRASRAEYWWFALFVVAAPTAGAMFDKLVLHWHARRIAAAVVLALIIPAFAAWTRRMHDIGRTGWWWPLMLVPVLGWLVLLVWACRRGTRGHNRYGADPLAARAR